MLLKHSSRFDTVDKDILYVAAAIGTADIKFGGARVPRMKRSWKSETANPKSDEEHPNVRSLSSISVPSVNSGRLAMLSVLDKVPTSPIIPELITNVPR